MIAIIDYGMGNVRSIINALYYIGYDAVITAEPQQIDDASHIILPGVGAFGDAMVNIVRRGLDEILKKQVFEKGKPFMGICLGLQLLAKCSEEHGHHNGLGWFDAEVLKFNLNGSRLKIPHMGWNEITPASDHFLFSHLKNTERTFYFVHSFHIVCHKQNDVAATCEYGINFNAAIARDNIVATQFHPEKSQDNGIQVLKNFLEWNP
ncbi:MAG: imidazole glycerol phosphate synthase subunit HisH [Nitrospirota bacterium]